MATSRELFQRLSGGGCDSALVRLYGQAQLARQRARYCDALLCFTRYFGPGRQVQVLSAPGRTELGGNHTDHQNGVAFAAAVDLDIIAVVSAVDAPLIRVKSYGFNKLDVVELDGMAPHAAESTHSASLIRGIAEEFRRMGAAASGFDAYTASDVLRGAGLSSSAAFEVVIGSALNTLYNGGRLTPLQIARIGQRAENTYFGKPSGLLDPLVSAAGGMLCVDFANPEKPAVQRLTADFARYGYQLCVTDTGGSHSELTAEFAAVRKEMEAVAHWFGKQVLRDVPERQVLAAVVQLRRACGDRALLRAIHFYAECRRAAQEYDCLKQGRFSDFLVLVQQSGHSAFEYNQNAYCINAPMDQPVPVALALSQVLLQADGAWRLQGSGFAGTIQAFVPTAMAAEYRAAMDGVFGRGSCRVLHLRGAGCIEPLAGAAAQTPDTKKQTLCCM